MRVVALEEHFTVPALTKRIDPAVIARRVFRQRRNPTSGPAPMELAPEIEVSVIARPEAPPLGVGEAATGPTAAAIGNAVRQALGIRVRALPITRDAIVAAMG